VLSDSPSLQEILWNFSRFKDEKQRLTLRDNPHFYSDPISLEARRDSLKIDPTDDFRHADKFYVLTDKPEPLYIVTDWGLQSFGNFWCLQNAVIFKGFASFFYSPPVSDVLPDICGRLRVDCIVREFLGGTYYGFCRRLPVSSISKTSKSRRLQPIITQGYPWMSWEHLIGCLPALGSIDFGLCVCSGRATPDSLVCCDVILFLQKLCILTLSL
jgi:hypothetical protein